MQPILLSDHLAQLKQGPPHKTWLFWLGYYYGLARYGAVRLLDIALTKFAVTRYPLGYLMEWVHGVRICRSMRKAAPRLLVEVCGGDKDKAKSVTKFTLAKYLQDNRLRWHHYRKQTECCVCGHRPSDLARFVRRPDLGFSYLCPEHAGEVAELSVEANFRQQEGTL